MTSTTPVSAGSDCPSSGSRLPWRSPLDAEGVSNGDVYHTCIRRIGLPFLRFPVTLEKSPRRRRSIQ
nr:MAG TPA: hypothetical protein [Caudoviricetes sp.]